MYSQNLPSLRPEEAGTDAPLAAGSSLPAAPSQPVVPFPYTGDYRIDTLLAGDGGTGTSALVYRWNDGSPLATPVTVTYSFMSVSPWYGGTDDGQGDTGFMQFTDAQKAAVRTIMGHLQQELGITLKEVPDSTFSYGQIRFGDNNQQFSAGYTWLPNSAGDDRSGDVWIDEGSPGSFNPAPGSYAWATLVHEIGHSLGLKHPGDYNAGSGSSSTPDNYLGTLEDNYNYTVMSYRDVPGGQYRDWYGMYDLLALKALYGSSGTYNAGDTTYSFTNADGAVLKIIDDASGIDTIDLSRLSSGALVDMRPGGFSSVGRNGTVAAANNLSIDLGTVVENLLGTPYDDTVTGNGANNSFSMGKGNNAVDGGAGIDTEIYGSFRSTYQVSQNAGTWHVAGTGTSDSLVNVERAQFADTKLALDLSGNAGEVAKILGAVFGPASVAAHPDYVGIGLALVDSGVSYANAAQYALDAKLGAGFSNAQEVTLLYTNVVGTAPSASDLAFYEGPLDNATQSHADLAIFAAEQPLNASHIDLVGLSQTGLAYT